MKPNKIFSFILIFSVVLIGCSSESDERQRELQFSEYLNRAQSAESSSELLAAEHYLLNAVNLLHQPSETEKMMQAYAMLAPVEKKLGKISAARNYYEALLRYYQTNSRRAEEFAVTLNLAELERYCGENKKAVTDLIKSADASEVLGLPEDYINAKLGLISVLVHQQLFQRAKNELNPLIERVVSTGNSALAGNVFSSAGEVFAQTGEKSRALRFFSAAENIVNKTNDNLLRANFYLRYGRSLFQQNQWNASLSCFTNALRLANQLKNLNLIGSVLIEIGEIYFKNFDNLSAQEYFQKAYETSQQSGNSLLSAFALLRLADCASREFAQFHRQQDGITATQRYEQTYSSFARINFPLGEAAVLFHLAQFKRISQDESAAITFYKRGFSAYLNSRYRFGADFTLLHFPGYILDEFSVFNAQEKVKPLLAMLLQQTRYADAVYYQELASTADQTASFEQYDYTLLDPDKQHLLDQYSQYRTKLTTAQSELILQYSNKNQMRSREFIAQHNNEIQNLNKQLLSIQTSAAQHFPTLLPLFGSSTFEISQLASFIELGTAIVRYVVVENQMWALTITAEGAGAVKISSFGDGLKNKMLSVINQFQSSPERRDVVLVKAQLSELYEFLIRPLEKYRLEKFVFILPDELQKFPMHALLKDGKPLIATTETAYLPSALFYQTTISASRYYSTASAVGLSNETKWGLEYELRGLRNYFRASTIWLNQHATEENLLKTTGEVLQISTKFQKNPLTKLQELSFSAGSISARGTWVQASRLLNLSPYRSVFLSNLTEQQNSISDELPAFILMNKTSSSIVTMHGLTPRLSKRFSEYYYSALAQTQNTMEAYQKALTQLSSDTEIPDDGSWATYFYFGK
ncbi:MAG: CHAT domain-containing protein [Bacteroidetes bacterium]|nr:CHAT domain-containing protein [Bacteroidota bacterium]